MSSVKERQKSHRWWKMTFGVRLVYMLLKETIVRELEERLELSSMALHFGRRGTVDVGNDIRFDYAERRGVAEKTVPVARSGRIWSFVLITSPIWVSRARRHAG